MYPLDRGISSHDASSQSFPTRWIPTPTQPQIKYCQVPQQLPILRSCPIFRTDLDSHLLRYTSNIYSSVFRLTCWDPVDGSCQKRVQAQYALCGGLGWGVVSNSLRPDLRTDRSTVHLAMVLMCGSHQVYAQIMPPKKMYLCIHRAVKPKTWLTISRDSVPVCI